jgi:hypothetical protein
MRVRFVPAVCATAAALAALVASAAVPAAASPAGPAAAAHSFRIKLVGIERNGRRTPVDAVIYGENYIPIYTSGKPVAVPAGPAWIGTGIETTGASGQVLSTTLVVRKVTISRNATIRLDARPGRLVTFSLAAPGASDTENTVQACVGGSFVAGFPVLVSGPARTLYEVPVRSRDVFFGYASNWQDAAATVLIAGQRRDGMPARPHFSAQLASMARLHLAFRTNTAVGGYSQLRFDNSGSCYIDQFYPAAAGERRTQYVSAGRWQVTAYGFRSFWQNTRSYAARHSYTDTFGAAIWGPGGGLLGEHAFPSISTNQLYFDPSNPIDDPLQDSAVCCDLSSITLAERHHVVKHSVLSELGAQRGFTADVPRAAWYTMTDVSHRRVPGLKTPSDMLSPRVIVSWRFRAAPLPASDPDSFIAPVSTAQFLAGGLNLENQAPSLGTTKLTMTLSWPTGGQFEILHLHKLKTVRLQVSFNGGTSWHGVSLVRHGRGWLASVHDPESGYVALRSTVIDSAGDSTVETIYQAYSVS